MWLTRIAGRTSAAAFNRNETADWQGKLSSAQATVDELSPKIASDYKTARAAYDAEAAAEQRLKAMKAQAISEIGTLQGVKDQSSAGEFESDIVTLQSTAQDTNSAYQADQASLKSAMSSLATLKASGPLTVTWDDGINSVLREVAILVCGGVLWLLLPPFLEKAHRGASP